MDGTVEIVALGARTPVGICAESAAAAVRAGVSGLGGHPVLLDGACKPLRCARDRLLPPSLTGAFRLVELMATAIDGLTPKLSAVSGGRKARLPLLLALPELRPGFSQAEVTAVARELRARTFHAGAQVDVEPIVAGHAGAFQALELAVRRLREGTWTIGLVGGVDSYFDVDTLAWLETGRRISRANVAGGMPPGEAAGLIALCAPRVRLALGLPSLAVVETVATGREPRSIDSDEGLLGEGLAAVIGKATRHLTHPNDLVDDIFCDINGERHRSDEWGFALLRVPGSLRDGAAYQTAVGSWGDVGAATPALGMILAVQAWRRKYARGRRALVVGSSTGGLRGSALLSQAGT